jgi:protocatechuate 3,4-dioxygenase beta subunit
VIKQPQKSVRRRTQQGLLSRRETLRLLGAAGATALVGFSGKPALRRLASGTRDSVVNAQSLSCVVRPLLTEGPYFVDERLNRSDIRTDPTTNELSPGALLTLTFNVTRVSGNSCSPLAGGYVDIWHCDALGTYSDVRDGGFDTRGQKYLRGYQVSDSSGSVRFQTIYPG